MTGAERIAAERQRQIDEEGYDVVADAGHAEHLAMAGAAYAQSPAYRNMAMAYSPNGNVPLIWPWRVSAWKPSPPEMGVAGRIRELEKAGALIAAAIDDLARDL